MIALLVGAVTVLAVVTRGLLLVVTVHGGSMRPALRPGDRILVLRLGWLARPGDVVVVVPPPMASAPEGLPRLRVKRLVARSGTAVPSAVRDRWSAPRPDPLPRGQVVVVGDHPRSEDSRQWGPLPARAVVGVMISRLRPSAGAR